MDTIKSLKFWIAMVVTIAVGVVSTYGPLWFGGVVILGQLFILAFYLKCEFGTFSVPMFTRVGVFAGYSGEEKAIESPGPVFRGMAIGVIIFYITLVVVGFAKN